MGGAFLKGSEIMAIMRIRDEDGNIYEIPVVKGDKGDPGYTPQKGIDYFDGADGYTPQKNVDYFDGHTPVKGVDYFTEEDVAGFLAEVTPETIGAAPAGYVLGESYCKRANSVEDITKSGYYILWLDQNNGDPARGNYTFHAIADAIYNNVHLQGKAGGGYLHRDKWDGIWQPWEWVDPPMALDVEYRTTERWNGKVVYTKLVNYGGLPNYTTYALAHGCAATCILRYCAVDETLGIAIPNSTTSITVDKNNISLTTNTTDVKGNIARVQIWYTKD